MIKKVVDGFLVKRIDHKGDKIVEEILGVEIKEYEARSRIERESEYFAENSFEYGRSIIKNGLAYVSHERDEQVHFVYEKCIIIQGAS